MYSTESTTDLHCIRNCTISYYNLYTTYELGANRIEGSYTPYYNKRKGNRQVETAIIKYNLEETSSGSFIRVIEQLKENLRNCIVLVFMVNLVLGFEYFLPPCI